MVLAAAYQLPDRAIPMSIGGLVFNVKTDTRELKVLKSGFEGWWDSPEMEIPDARRPFGHGSFSERGWNAARIINLSGKAYCASIESAVATKWELSGLLGDGGYDTFTVNDPWEGVMMAQVQRASRVRVDHVLPGVLDFQISLKAPDARKYGPTASVSTGIARASGGLRFPLFAGAGDGGIPGVLDFGNSGSLGNVRVQNAGTATTYPLLTVEGYAPGFKITERETRKALAFSGVVSNGQSVVLNPRTGTVMLDGYADRSTQLKSEGWPSVPPGQSRTYLFESAGKDAKLTVETAPAWW